MQTTAYNFKHQVSDQQPSPACRWQGLPQLPVESILLSISRHSRASKLKLLMSNQLTLTIPDPLSHTRGCTSSESAISMALPACTICQSKYKFESRRWQTINLDIIPGNVKVTHARRHVLQEHPGQSGYENVRAKAPGNIARLCKLRRSTSELNENGDLLMKSVRHGIPRSASPTRCVYDVFNASYIGSRLGE